ncbi:uncharacterized protein LOC141616942 [Silene latifolia]|uniref:uncharacterized protein LOC141616942 n=1 Tax=Silene latifolia TaxID=37657 RepID=UPI003D781C28
MSRRTRRGQPIDPIDHEIEATARRLNSLRRRGLIETPTSHENLVVEDFREEPSTFETFENPFATPGEEVTMVAVPMRDNLAPKKVVNPSIVKPPIQANSFDVKSTLLQLVQGNQFGGGATENPNEHLNEFLDSCDMFKANGVSEDVVRLRLFPYSLWGSAKEWLKICKPDYVRTWDDVSKAFLNKYFPPQRTARIKSELQGFTQQEDETLYEACERHKRKGNSMVESANNVEVKGLIEELKQQVALMSSSNTSSNSSSMRNQVYSCEICGDQGHPPNECPLMVGEGNFIEQVNGIWESSPAKQAFNNNQYHPGMRTHPNFSYGSQNVQNPTFQQKPQFTQNFQAQKPNTTFNQGPPGFQGRTFQPRQQFQPLNPPSNPPFQQNSQPFQQSTQPKSNVELMIEQLMSSQTQFINHSTQKQEETTSSINQLRIQMQASQRMTDNQISQLASQMSQLQASHGKFPGKTEENPKTINAIHLRSGRDLEDRTFIKKRKSGRPGDEVEPQIMVEPPKGVEEKGVEDELVEIVVETPKMIDEPTKIVELPKQQVVRTYMPPIHFPQRLERAKLEQKYGKFMDMMKGINITMSFIDALKEIPSYGKFLKELISNKNSLSPTTMVNLSKECSAILMNEAPQKLEDPGSFSIPCKIGTVHIERALCDLGASISLMPLKIFKKLKGYELSPTRAYLQLVDRSVRYPIGLVEDVLLKVGKLAFPCDFYVMDIPEDSNIPIILGRPYLATGGAMIDVNNGKLSLQVGE